MTIPNIILVVYYYVKKLNYKQGLHPFPDGRRNNQKISAATISPLYF